MIKSSLPYTQNRDVSWLKFNARVLEMSLNKETPLLERLFFLKIANNNLDEFFMIRMGSMLDVIHLKPDALDARTKIPIKEQTKLVFEEARKQHQYKDACYDAFIIDAKDILFEITTLKSLSKSEFKEVETFYQTMLVPILSPQLIDQNHPFPHILNKKLHIGLVFEQERTLFGILPIPNIHPVFTFKEGKKGVYVHDILMHYIKEIFKNFKIHATTLFAVTRNADIPYDDEAYDDSYDMRSKMKALLKKRLRLSTVRLEVLEKTDKRLNQFFEEKLNILPFQTFEVSGPMVFDFDYVFSQVPNEIKHQHKFQPLKPNHNRYSGESIMKHLLKRDIILAYPYDVMDPFLSLMKEAALDKDVLSIKITIYRLAEKASLIDLLVLAAESGKEVIVVIELKARFDEQNNIDFSETLELAGCKVIYGFEQLKVHSKVCVITKRVKAGLQYFTHIGTGNYNETTVKQYTDFSLLTSHEGIGKDAIKVFQSIGMSDLNQSYEHIWVAPVNLKANILKHIELETLKKFKGYICFKINALTDMDMIEALVKASQEGVKIDLIIRSICCLLPGIKEYTEHIEVRSIVGRYLEHSRVYVFGKENPTMFIGSADFMTRNTERRIEVAIPIYDKDIQHFMLHYIGLWLQDTVHGKRIDTEGNHQPILSTANVSSQLYYFEHNLSSHEVKTKQKSFLKLLFSRN
jgi:polyphosphate kinase